MADNVKGKFFSFLRGNKPTKEALKQNLQEVSVVMMDERFKAGDLIGAATILRNLLEIYGMKKDKKHRYKGREFIHFILSNKHKDLKNTGYVHWQNINKIIHLNHDKVYPYHQNNLEQAMTFFKKEVKSINSIRGSM